MNSITPVPLHISSPGQNIEKECLVSQGLCTASSQDVTENIPLASEQTSVKKLPQHQTLTELVAQGTINSVIMLGNNNWIAGGNWSIILDKDNVTLFETKMTWYNTSGTGVHSHEFLNFNPVDTYQSTSILESNNNVIIKGTTDVGTNGRVTWKQVPIIITINGNRTVSISVDDNKTNHHFAGQPILGIVSYYIPCSASLGPDMKGLSYCRGSSREDTTSIAGGLLPEKFISSTNIDSNEDGNLTNLGSRECQPIDIKDVIASDFEKDPLDYHPPSDAIDHNPSTWWSSQGKQVWLKVDLGKISTLCKVLVQWNKGDSRKYSFSISVFSGWLPI